MFVTFDFSLHLLYDLERICNQHRVYGDFLCLREIAEHYLQRVLVAQFPHLSDDILEKWLDVLVCRPLTKYERVG